MEIHSYRWPPKSNGSFTEQNPLPQHGLGDLAWNTHNQSTQDVVCSLIIGDFGEIQPNCADNSTKWTDISTRRRGFCHAFSLPHQRFSSLSIMKAQIIEPGLAFHKEEHPEC